MENEETGEENDKEGEGEEENNKSRFRFKQKINKLSSKIGNVINEKKQLRNFMNEDLKINSK